MALKDAKIASVADDIATALTRIQPSDLRIIGAPSSPAQNDVWIELTGTTTRTIAFRIYDQGAARTLFSIEYEP